eukprot:CAMPEP_0197037642 /NCGR_PEP_ID=MMETSP1384-20130603/14794_1 /TAXON_ID=29189 /ORGANISM="Ammonia sp." /LENGTH=358 /DNA_ID=CAMNT_0042467967 /DNA_START=1631 /DNA_END=2707 /DNA_ORIENTATION=+
MAENNKTTASSQARRSKKRKYGGKDNRPPHKKPKFAYEVNLTKSKNLILCSCVKYKEKRCGRDLHLVFNECIEEMLKKEKGDEISPSNKAENDDTSNTDDASKVAIEQAETNNNNNNTGNDKKEVDNEEDENEDDDLKLNKSDTSKHANNKEDKAEPESTNANQADSDKNDKNENNGTAEPKAEISVSDAIQKELATLNEDKQCDWIEGPGGLVIINILNEEIKASKLCEFVFEKCHPKRPDLSPHVFRLYPLDCTCYAKEQDIIEMARKVIEQEDWSTVKEDDVYAIVYKNRGNKGQIDRDKLMKAVGGFMPATLKVDLSKPTIVVLLQTFGRNAGISIIRENAFAKHQEYNLGKFV